MPQILLSPYFREELQQRTQDGVCSGRAPLAPAGLHQVSGLSSWRSWGCLLGVGSSRIAVLEGPVSPQDEMGRPWTDRCTWPGRGVQAGNVTGIIAGRKGKGQSGQVGYSTYVWVMVVLSDTTQSHKEWWSGSVLSSCSLFICNFPLLQ